MIHRIVRPVLGIGFAFAGIASAHAQGYVFHTIAAAPGTPAGAIPFVSGYTDTGLMIVGAQVPNVSYNYTAVDDLYDANTNTFTPLPAAPGATANSTATMGINDAGTMVGYYHPNGGSWQAFSVTSGVYTNLAAPGGTATNAYGISNNGQIVGSVGPSDFSSTSGFLLSGGNYQTINAAPSPANSTNVYAVNDSGAMVGVWGASSADFWGNSFVDVGGTFTAISMPGMANTLVGDINDAGTIVGGASNDPFDLGFTTGPGFVDRNGVFTAVNVPGAVETFVTGINDLGDINGTYIDANGDQHVFVAAPVPEPTGGSMLALAVAGLAVMRRWARRGRTSEA